MQQLQDLKEINKTKTKPQPFHFHEPKPKAQKQIVYPNYPAANEIKKGRPQSAAKVDIKSTLKYEEYVNFRKK